MNLASVTGEKNEPGHARRRQLTVINACGADKAWGSGAGTLLFDRQSYLNRPSRSSHQGLALCHKARHASRPSGVRLIVRVAPVQQTAGLQLVQRHADPVPTRTGYSAQLAPARDIEGRPGHAGAAVARIALLAVARSTARHPAATAPVHHRLHRRPGRASQPEHGPERANRPQPATDRRTTADSRRTAGLAAQTPAIAAPATQPGIAEPVRHGAQRHRSGQPRCRLPQRTGAPQS